MPKAAWNRVLIDREWLERVYLQDRLSISQIAIKLGVSGRLVHNRLREYAIPTRSVSEAKLQFPISEAKLRDLYFKKKWSMFQIADYYGCTHGTIVHRFKQFGLKSRGHLGLTPPISISKKALEHLYHDKNFSVEQIAKRLGRSKGGVERRLTQYGIKTRGNKHRKHWKYEKKPFDGTLEEKAYMIGFRLGDLNVTKTNQVVVVRGSTTRFSQMKLFTDLFEKYGGVSTAKASRGTFEQYVFLDRSFDFLIPKHYAIDPWISSCPRCFLAFFSGYFDAEGHVRVRETKKGSVSGFNIKSYDQNILLESWKLFCSLGVLCARPTISALKGYISSNGIVNNGDVWRLDICAKRSVWVLFQYMNNFMKHEDKLRSLKGVEKNIIERNRFRRGGKVIDLSIPRLPQHRH